MEPSYKLVYFNSRARAEPIRLMFAWAGVHHENKIIDEEGPEWLRLQTSGALPFGQLPLLLVDGITLSQSKSIIRFVARRVGLVPNGEMDIARADQIMEGIDDLFPKCFEFQFFEQDSTKKEKLKKAFLENDVPVQLRFFEKLLKSNRGGNGYFVGDKLSYADIVFFNFCNSTLADGKPEVPDALKEFHLLVDHYNRVLNEPRILNWIQTRDEYSF